MMNYDPVNQKYGSSRYLLTAKRGMVASSCALASDAGLDMLKLGGNAVDAAVATAAVLSVTEPTSNGIGGDAFAIVWMNNQLYGLNGSGNSPRKLDIETLHKMGLEKIPEHGWIPVMIPGQPRAWADLISRFGKLTLRQVLSPAIRIAEEGYPVSPVLSYLWGKYVAKNKEEYQKSEVFKNWLDTFTKNGQPYAFGDVVKFPDHARTLKLLADTNCESFYSGEIASAIVEQSTKDGGFISIEDLNTYHCDWVNPISVNYRGYDIWELPPNGQGLVALLALNILKNQTFNSLDQVNNYHKLFEAMKMSFSDGINIITDPSDMKTDYHDYLNARYGTRRYQEIRDRAETYLPLNPFNSGTVYLCTADSEGNMVSYIQSNYHDFGSGIVIGKYGISLQNRGFDFSLNPKDVNCLMPGKKSYHTIIPGFITRNNQAIGPFGVMGGYMQPQGHVQVVTNLIDFNLNPQMALDAPRWQWTRGKEFIVEPEFNRDIADELVRRGHEIKIAENRFSFGRGQIIQRLDNGVLVGGTESRTDSNISCY